MHFLPLTPYCTLGVTYMSFCCYVIYSRAPSSAPTSFPPPSTACNRFNCTLSPTCPHSLSHSYRTLLLIIPLLCPLILTVSPSSFPFSFSFSANGRIDDVDKVISDFDDMMKARKGVVRATIISAEPLKKKNLDVISSAIVDLAGVNKTVSQIVCLLRYLFVSILHCRNLFIRSTKALSIFCCHQST